MDLFPQQLTDNSLKLLATSGLPADVLNNLTVKITPGKA